MEQMPTAMQSQADASNSAGARLAGSKLQEDAAIYGYHHCNVMQYTTGRMILLSNVSLSFMTALASTADQSIMDFCIPRKMC